MPLVDDIQEAFRDFVSWSASYPLPVGNPSTGVHNPSKAEIRNVLIAMLQAAGDPEALQEIIDDLAGKADLQNITASFTTRDAAIARGQGNLPSSIGMVLTRESDRIVVRAASATADDPLFATAPRWGVVLRLPNVVEFDSEISARQLGQVLRLNSTAGSDAITAVLPSAQTVGTSLAQDARVMLSPAASNTGNNVTLNIGYGVHPITAPEGGPLLPGDFKQGLPVLLRFSTASGGQWRVVDGIARSRPAVVVQRATAAIDIYLHQTGDDYVHVQLTRVPRPERNSDVWRIDRCRHVRASSRTSYTHVADITTPGSEIEQVIYFVGGSNGVGGYIHGNEELTSFGITLDGVSLSANGWYSGRNVVMTQTSRGFLPGATSGTTWSPKGPQISTINRTWRISSYPASIEIDNRNTMSSAGHTVNRGYAGMLPMLIDNIDTAAYFPYQSEEAVVSGDDILSNAHRMIVWGNTYWGEAQVTEGWTRPDREMRIKLDSTPLGKIYPDAFRGLVSSVGSSWRAKTLLRVGISGETRPGKASPATVGDIAALYAAIA